MRVVGVTEDEVVIDHPDPSMRTLVLLRAMMRGESNRIVFRTLVTDGELYAWVTTPDTDNPGPYVACHGPRLSSADHEVIKVAIRGYAEAVG
jgi:hypothetical protein